MLKKLFELQSDIFCYKQIIDGKMRNYHLIMYKIK